MPHAMGRSRSTIGAHEVLVDGRIIVSKAVSCDEEYMPWLKEPHKPLTPSPQLRLRATTGACSPRCPLRPVSRLQMQIPPRQWCQSAMNNLRSKTGLLVCKFRPAGRGAWVANIGRQ